jgi:CRP/FNR family transcriptional regulator, cyclic AMP receptor protein
VPEDIMPSATHLQDQNEPTVAGQSPMESFLQDFVAFADTKLRGIRPRGFVIFSEGQPATGVHILRSGRAKVAISSSEAKTVILRIAQPGDLLGVNAVLKGLPYEATVETLERCQVDFIPCSDFLKILDRSKTAQVGVTRALGNELSEVVERARSLLLSQSAAEKLAGLVVKWCDEQGEVAPEGIRVNPGLTHEEIAQMICASRETVTRLFAEFRRKEIVSFAGNAIFVRHLNALESMVCR